jgi:hypothetical protein
MRNNNDNIGTTNEVPTSEQIVEGLLRADELPTMRQHLRVMADTYLLQEDESHYRRQVFESYMALDIMLKKVEMLSPKRERRDVA